MAPKKRKRKASTTRHANAGKRAGRGTAARGAASQQPEAKARRAAAGRRGGRAKRASKQARSAPATRRAGTGHAAAAKKAPASRPRAKAQGASAQRKWSARVMRTSDALDLEEGVFRKDSPRQIALSLKRSAERSHRRKSEPFRSAMSMLNFEINRGGRNLTAERRHVLNAAKQELRKVFHREPAR